MAEMLRWERAAPETLSEVTSGDPLSSASSKKHLVIAVATDPSRIKRKPSSVRSPWRQKNENFLQICWGTSILSSFSNNSKLDFRSLLVFVPEEDGSALHHVCATQSL